MGIDLDLLIPTTGTPTDDYTAICFSQSFRLPRLTDLHDEVRDLQDSQGIPIEEITDADPPAIASGHSFGEEYFSSDSYDTDLVLLRARHMQAFAERWEEVYVQQIEESAEKAGYTAWVRGNAVGVLRYLQAVPPNTLVCPYWC